MKSLPALSANAFPAGTPLNAFFAWNEARRLTDRRYRIARAIAELRGHPDRAVCLAYLAGHTLGLRRFLGRIIVPAQAAAQARDLLTGASGSAAVRAARELVSALQSAIGSADITRHAAVFAGFEELAKHVDLDALARLRPQPSGACPRCGQRRILIIKLGALGDVIQALGPMPEIRDHHAGDHISLLTTARYAELARQTRLFDRILIDPRPGLGDLRGWLRLRRMLRRGCFDRVYDFQTSDRSSAYFWLLRPGPVPQWSGTAWRCSHPHGNSRRDRQHTMDRQAEQLLMAGIHPVSLTPRLPLPAAGAMPPQLAGRRFAMLIPGSSPGHPAKRWPAWYFGELARRLVCAGYLPVVVGAADEQAIGQAITAACPDAIDLVGCTDLLALAALAHSAALTIGNDTGATHLAAAAGGPVVVLFSRASRPSLCAPRGAAVQVLSEPDLAALAVDRVFAIALALVGVADAADRAVNVVS
ncbi:MAG: glycosyltransferase family 9 protein [Stellaceae bacterium]